ncbi:MAG: PilZ domain-containing protein [Candidatus Omnitrophica bacterium]|nr:PilZ domain-containing protein [Candidatus Omnitrophota bacterium]
MLEKRKSTRIEKSLIIKYSPDLNSKDNWDISSIKNLSEAGILFDTNKQFQAGENIQLLFKIPFDPYNWIEAKGSVIESIPYIGGSFLTRIKFISINEAQKKLIKDYVDWFLRNKKPDNLASSDNEKRKAERIYKSLIVSYGIQNHLGIVEKWDITTVINFSKTGMVFTSNYICGDAIDFMIKLPSQPYENLCIRGRIIECKALKLANPDTSAGTFLTRVEFIDLRNEQNKLLCDYVDWLINNDPGRPKKEDA